MKRMILIQCLTFCLLLIPLTFVVGQTTIVSYYTAYQRGFPFVTSCLSTQYYDIALMQCSPCPDNSIQLSTDSTQCDCLNNTYYYANKQGGGSLLCALCPSGQIRSIDGFGCATAVTTACDQTGTNSVLSESSVNGAFYTPTTSGPPRTSGQTCSTCQAGTWPLPNSQRCIPCASTTPYPGLPTGTLACCTASTTQDGICLTNMNGVVSGATYVYQNTFTSPTTSVFITQHLQTALLLCRMNLNAGNAQSTTRLLLTNATACQVLANIAAMQFYLNIAGYAYYLYDNFIWTPTDLTSVWSVATNRTSIPFLAYPSTFYNEISSSTYNWIPANFAQGDIIGFKLAKYSSTGVYLGLIDAIDATIQLCGGGYTEGRPAFTFGTQFQKSCTIRVDTLWNSTLYETAFFDPYIVYTQSGITYMLPTPVVMTNYRTALGSTPNKLNGDESSWTYHRRFFLLDRISGITTNNELRNIHYAKSITILNTLTNGGTYIQPPVLVVEYGELSTSDVGKGTTVQVSFASQYRMNLDDHIRAIWIAFGVLAGLGIILAFAQTWVWHLRSGKEIIDLPTIGKLFLHLFGVLANIFFIVMAGVALWWLIFFKRQDVVYLVIPTTAQQASFTALIAVAFALKTLDILHMIIQQANVDIFFIDWEKPKTGIANSVSVWRTYFVANEYNEIQTYRRINVTLQLMFVLFFLKVINLENVATAQPGVNLFPSSEDYVPGYNGILRVGIAFSMWLGTALVQYLVYVLFYQRFVEDRLINFIDLCSISNVSVFILSHTRYGYYIHGRSPHGTADVNMKDMIINFERESNQMTGTRGLQAKSDEQTFIISVDRGFRTQYDVLLMNYQNQITSRQAKKGNEKESEIIMNTYRNINEFLCSFINHSLPSYNYSIRNRFLLEKIFNYEFQYGTTVGLVESLFFVDPDKNFSRALFIGHENSLFIWNMATFLFIDYFATNYVLAAIITYLLNQLAEKMRNALGRKNLSKKTTIPKHFLI